MNLTKTVKEKVISKPGRLTCNAVIANTRAETMQPIIKRLLRPEFSMNGMDMPDWEPSTIISWPSCQRAHTICRWQCNDKQGWRCLVAPFKRNLIESTTVSVNTTLQRRWISFCVIIPETRNNNERSDLVLSGAVLGKRLTYKTWQIMKIR